MSDFSAYGQITFYEPRLGLSQRRATFEPWGTYAVYHLMVTCPVCAKTTRVVFKGRDQYRIRNHIVCSDCGIVLTVTGRNRG